MTQNILSLSSSEALKYFLKSEHYHNFELPEYFVFDDILKFVAQKIGDKSYEECVTALDSANLCNVNFDILLNKDGKYAVRPLTLANPYLYYFLVKEICCEDGWQKTIDCFNKYKVSHITSSAIPVVVDENKKEPFHNSTTILNWWNSIEQRSLELSLEYRYMFVTDITNCYGSINPQSIEWALTFKNTYFATDANKGMANSIMILLSAFQQGRNIGIPQGSLIFDFIAEFVLGYTDLLLSEALEKANIKGYEILRYRDDYRIFCNDKGILEEISYILQHVLETLNFRLNSQKTKISDSIVFDSIKPDKLYYIENTPIFNKKGVDFDGIEKHLLYILIFGRKYPNGGQIKNMLSDLDKRIIKKLAPKKMKTMNLDSVKITIKEEPGKIKENIRAIAAIGTQIAIENVSHTHYALRVVSRLIDSLDDEQEKWDIRAKVCDKLCNRPNSTYDKIWLQNITYSRDKKLNICPYNERLCQLVAGNSVELWNNSWLKPELIDGLPMNTVVNNQTLDKVTPVITFRETRAYYEA